MCTWCVKSRVVKHVQDDKYGKGSRKSNDADLVDPEYQTSWFGLGLNGSTSACRFNNTAARVFHFTIQRHHFHI